jgi:hypothetical protein
MVAKDIMAVRNKAAEIEHESGEKSEKISTNGIA